MNCQLRNRKKTLQVIFAGFMVAMAHQASAEDADPEVTIVAVKQNGDYHLELRSAERALLRSPQEGLWSIATDFRDDWPADWKHAHPNDVKRVGPWTVVSGEMTVPGGVWKLSDAYRPTGEKIKCVRRFTWKGEEPAKRCTLSIRWQTDQPGAQAFLPGILYYGNPSGAASGRVPVYRGTAGEMAIYEEHRYPMPFASLEWKADGRHDGATLHTIPSLAPYGNQNDQWWSLGVIGQSEATELTLLSGPCASNGEKSVVKALQREFKKYPDTFLNVPPDAVIEKTFYLQAYPVERAGSGFEQPMRTAMAIFEPYRDDDLPGFREILESKYRFAVSRWHETKTSAGFRMFSDRDTYVMGWAGQSEAPGYALLVLADKLRKPKAIEMAQKTLDHLSQSPLNEKGFCVRYNPDKEEWGNQDFVSQGQAMEIFARAILYGRNDARVETQRWEQFLRKSCDFHANRILADDWRPVSTNEGFLVSPLCKAYRLLGQELHRKAAIKAAEHYADRHLSMEEPYWGGTLDARAEDKEGAWAGFQTFLAVYEMTGDERHLRWAEHALYVTLSYTVIWDITMPPGRLANHRFRTRGWTVVSAQNQHLDVYGVLYTPEIYRMGEYLGREELKKLAMVMYRTCGQLIDASGSQGEQIQHTNFAQRGDMSNVYTMRGGYAENWTVFWITAHFLNAAAQFVEMGVPILDD